MESLLRRCVPLIKGTLEGKRNLLRKGEPVNAGNIITLEIKGKSRDIILNSKWQMFDDESLINILSPDFLAALFPRAIL